jgi:hypothetical protein
MLAFIPNQPLENVKKNDTEVGFSTDYDQTAIPLRRPSSDMDSAAMFTPKYHLQSTIEFRKIFYFY